MSAILTYFRLIVTPKSAMSCNGAAGSSPARVDRAPERRSPRSTCDLPGVLSQRKAQRPSEKAQRSAARFSAMSGPSTPGRLRNGTALRSTSGPDLARRQAHSNRRLQVSVLTHGLHYASAVFEGERAYGGEIFKSHEHSERLKRSAQDHGFEIRFSAAEIDAAHTRDREEQSKRRLRAGDRVRGSEQLGVSAQNNTIHLAVATWEWPSYFDPPQRLKGIRLDLAEYRRPDPKTAPWLAKAAGLYAICTISKHRAERRGFADAMMLDWQGRVANAPAPTSSSSRTARSTRRSPIASCPESRGPPRLRWRGGIISKSSSAASCRRS